MSDTDQPGRHTAAPTGRAEALLALLAVIAESRVAVVGLGVLALIVIATVYGGITGSIDPLGITVTTVLVAALAVKALRRANRTRR